MRNLFFVAACAIALTTSGLFQSTAHGGIISIDFDDGTGDGLEIGNFYQSLGITFIDAAWNDAFDTRPGSSSPFQLGSLSSSSQPKAGTPIVGVFSFDVDMVSISAIDVGFNDAQLDVYDSAVGGTLIASSIFEGVTELGNTGAGQDTGVLSVAVSGIRRFEIYQPKSDTPFDGVLFDNLSFNEANVVPEPATYGLFLAMLGIGVCRRSRRSDPTVIGDEAFPA